MEENKESIEEKEKMVKLFKLKRLIKKLEECKGSGTSMVTLIMPPKK